MVRDTAVQVRDPFSEPDTCVYCLQEIRVDKSIIQPACLIGLSLGPPCVEQLIARGTALKQLLQWRQTSDHRQVLLPMQLLPGVDQAGLLREKFVGQ